jgi:hypothetical protein
MLFVFLLLTIVHGNYRQMIRDTCASQHPVNIFCNEDDDMT